MTMLAVAVILVASGAAIFADGSGRLLLARLDAVAPHYGSMTNPESLLFRDLFEVVVANFVIGLAIIMQPHIISKSLYLRSERDVNTYLVTAMVAGTVFTTVLLVGLYARLEPWRLICRPTGWWPPTSLRASPPACAPSSCSVYWRQGFRPSRG